MDFAKVIELVISQLNKEEVQYALIGGGALSLHGVQRATMDLDFILFIEDVPCSNQILCDLGYKLVFKNENVSHYEADDATLGRIDIIHAFRARSVQMLRRAEKVEVLPGIEIPVVAIEDLIGLKVQAIANDKSRELVDWFDVQSLVELAARQKKDLDWDLLVDYFTLFDMNSKMLQIKEFYESIDR